MEGNQSAVTLGKPNEENCALVITIYSENKQAFIVVLISPMYFLLYYYYLPNNSILLSGKVVKRFTYGVYL